MMRALYDPRSIMEYARDNQVLPVRLDERLERAGVPVSSNVEPAIPQAPWNGRDGAEPKDIRRLTEFVQEGRIYRAGDMFEPKDPYDAEAVEVVRNSFPTLRRSGEVGKAQRAAEGRP